jgi:hypothetical protein
MFHAPSSFNCRFLHRFLRPETGLVDLYEAKSLDGDTLRAIAVTLFGVTNLD